MFICTRSNKEDLEDAKVITYADSEKDVITALVKLGELNGKQSEWKSYDFSNTAICVNEKYLFVISEVTSKDFEEMLKVADLTKEQYLNLIKQYGVDKKVRSAEEILAEQNLSKKVGRGSVKATLVIWSINLLKPVQCFYTLHQCKLKMQA